MAFTIKHHREIAATMNDTDKVAGKTQAELAAMVRAKEQLPDGVSYAPGEAIQFVAVPKEAPKPAKKEGGA